MATNEIKRITEILWEQMKINDEADKKNSTLASSRGNNKNNGNDYSVAREFSNLHSVAANKKKSKSNRDSLAFRDSPGKPGTKRFNRYLNTQFLKTAGSLGSGNGDIEMDYNFYEQRNTLFYQDQQNSKYYLDNCVNISCDQEQEILDNCSTSSKKSNLRKKNNDKNNNDNSNNSLSGNEDNELFSKLKKNLRPFFKKSFLMDSHFVQETEKEILSFIRGDDCPYGSTPINRKEFNQDNPSKRLIIHGLASYYSLHSKSHTTNNGQRILVLRKSRPMQPLPEQSIVQYLISESKKRSVQVHQVQRKKVIKKSQTIYIKKRVLATPVIISADIPNSDD
ncbi:hypothetical protein RB653_008155 [Dictyostelium firmibasis]|uniref:R3H domain-containing protein n=1 Tax=Dictyostelium firmibasis TaxID=79012 RepID=A0AAN7TS56_9MYCE